MESIKTEIERSMSTGVVCVYVDVATPSVDVRIRILSVSKSLKENDQSTFRRPLIAGEIETLYPSNKPSVSLTIGFEPSADTRTVVQTEFGPWINPSDVALIIANSNTAGWVSSLSIEEWWVENVISGAFG